MNLQWKQIAGHLAAPNGESEPVEIAGWTAVRSQNRLVRGDKEIVLEPKVMDLLLHLAAAGGQTVSREELLATVWPGVFVADDSLYRAISLLRRAFADHRELAGSIVTVPRRGYSFRTPDRPAKTMAAADDCDPTAPSSDPAAPLGANRSVRPWIAAAVGLLVVGGAALALRPQNDIPFSQAQMHTRPFTSYHGQERSASFSPGGQQVVFSWQGESGSNWDLYVKGIRGDVPKRLTFAAAAEFGAAWSPRGDRIAFVSLDRGACRINLVTLDGKISNLRGCTAGGDTDLAWSSDGHTLFFSDRVGRTGPIALHAMRLADRKVSQISFPPVDAWGDQMPAVSPAGDRIAFARSSAMGVTDVWIMPATGGRARQVTEDRLKIHGIDWASDQDILFSSNRGGVFALWRKPLAGGEPVPFMGSGMRADSIDVAPSLDRMIFEDERVTTRLWVQRLGGGAQRAISTTGSWDWHPAYAPDGERVAFISDRSGSPELWVQDQAGARRLTEIGGPYLQTPSWSPDGSRLVFAAAKGGNFDVYVVDGDGSGLPRRLTRHPASDQNPSWSRDGRYVFFGSRRTGPWEIWRIEVETGNTAQVTDSGGFRAEETQSGHIVYVRREGAGLYRMDPRRPGTAEHLIASDLLPLDWANWAVAENQIYFAAQAENGTRVYRLTENGARQEVARFDEIPYFSGMAVSPDGQRLLIAQTDVIQSNLMLVEETP